MKNGRILLAMLSSMLIFFACDDNKSSQGKQEQVTSPALSAKEPQADEVINLDESPTIVKRVEPVYPKDAMEGNIEGTVFLTVLVSKEGAVKKAKVTGRKDGSESLEKAAREAVMQFTFTPARIKKQPVEVWVSIPFRFKLAEKK